MAGFALRNAERVVSRAAVANNQDFFSDAVAERAHAARVPAERKHNTADAEDFVYQGALFAPIAGIVLAVVICELQPDALINLFDLTARVRRVEQDKVNNFLPVLEHLQEGSSLHVVFRGGVWIQVICPGSPALVSSEGVGAVLALAKVELHERRDWRNAERFC